MAEHGFDEGAYQHMQIVECEIARRQRQAQLEAA